MRPLTSLANQIFSERIIHLAFSLALWFKGALAVMEIAGGVTTYFATRHFLVGLANTITHGELARDPNDLVANFILDSVQQLGAGTQHFMAYYLVSHGIVKLWLIVGLLRTKLWYYPIAIAVFGLFILYQLYRFDSTHSFWLLLITAVDALVIVLTWHEYRYIRRMHKVSE